VERGKVRECSANAHLDKLSESNALELHCLGVSNAVVERGKHNLSHLILRLGVRGIQLKHSVFDSANECIQRLRVGKQDCKENGVNFEMCSVQDV
jgi:hypothetical protein